jgi:hypothetical protein
MLSHAYSPCRPDCGDGIIDTEDKFDRVDIDESLSLSQGVHAIQAGLADRESGCAMPMGDFNLIG